MPRVFYNEKQFRPTLHRARLHKPGEERHWSDKGWWLVGLDWRPGAPAFLSNLVLTELYRRLFHLYDLRQQRDHQAFQLQIVPLNEQGQELPDEKFFFVPTAPIDDLDDREEYQRWMSAA